VSRTVAIVGRPNVGKSALFNRLAGRKIAIVHDQPGVTRDRIPADCKLGNSPFTIFDTGGIGADVDLEFTSQVHAEVDIALATSDVLLFVVDGQEGLTHTDVAVAKLLRKAHKPIILLVNKIDHQKHGPLTAEFTKLGFEHVISGSAEHGLGIKRLVESMEEFLPPPEEHKEGPKNPMKIAIVGRPNVGKSSLTNAIMGDNRTMVSPISGTTRDAVDIQYHRAGNDYILIDTAGMRPRGKVNNSVEVFSAMRSENSIRRADLCCLVIDATVGITAHDKKIAGMIQEAHKPCILAVNKWDLVKDKTEDKEKLNAFIEVIQQDLFFLPYAPLIMLSAKTGASLTRLFKTIETIDAGAKKKLGTGPLNRLLATALTEHPPGVRSGKRFKLLYATQTNHDADGIMSAPHFTFFVNDHKLLPDSYTRYLEAQIRAKFPYVGLPMLFHFRDRPPREVKRSKSSGGRNETEVRRQDRGVRRRE